MKIFIHPSVYYLYAQTSNVPLHLPKKKQAGLDIIQVTHCTGHVSVNTRPHVYHAEDKKTTCIWG